MRRPVKLATWHRLLGASCEICHRREREEGKLQIHHKDGNPKNNADWNLAYAHKACHNSLTKLNQQYSSRPLRGHDSGTGSDKRGREIVASSYKSVAKASSSSRPVYAQGEVEERTRSIKIKIGLYDYLGSEAVPKNETMLQILANAPSWIDYDDPPSEQALRRWLKIYTSGQYPFRFDRLGRLLMLDPKDVEQVKA